MRATKKKKKKTKGIAIRANKDFLLNDYQIWQQRDEHGDTQLQLQQTGRLDLVSKIFKDIHYLKGWGSNSV